MFTKKCKSKTTVKNPSTNEVTTENSPLVKKGIKGSIYSLFAQSGNDEYQLTEEDKAAWIARVGEVLHEAGLN